MGGSVQGRLSQGYSTESFAFPQLVFLFYPKHFIYSLVQKICFLHFLIIPSVFIHP